MGRCEAVPASAASAGGHAPWLARLALGFERRGGRSVLVERRHVGPLAFQKPLYPEGGHVCHGILLHPPAGIAGGDELAFEIRVGAGAHVLLTTPGAGKWYRSAGPVGCLDQAIEVADGGVCEWLPQEAIVFDGACGEMRTTVELASGARFLGAEVLVFGRTGAGERFDRGRLSLSTRIRRDGRTLWLERGRVDGGGALLSSPVGLGGEPVCATLLLAADEVDRDGAALLDACRRITAVDGEWAVSRVPGVLVARYRGPGSEAARRWLVALWQVLRPAVLGEPARIPRIWNT
ncbi:MAG: urease accessory protein UreD [Rhodocyclaceae bacterium]|nr:urease accessory protein UreD [Rhodocyclaceae bacterium]